MLENDRGSRTNQRTFNLTIRHIDFTYAPSKKCTKQIENFENYDSSLEAFIKSEFLVESVEEFRN